MRVIVIKTVMRCFHRSWFQWWENTMFHRVVVTSGASDWEVLKAHDDWFFVDPMFAQSWLLSMPFESYIRSATSTVMGAHLTVARDLEYFDWKGHRVNILVPWVDSATQARIEWRNNHSRRLRFTEIPYTYDFDWTNRYMNAGLHLALDIIGSEMLIPTVYTTGDTAKFARLSGPGGYLPVTGYRVSRTPMSDTKRRWSY